ncbi:MAG: hypothetical protein MK108_17915 [Mariniblastus sp.]|nr:hypothetical protein [Mariniblastus sp.]
MYKTAILFGILLIANGLYGFFNSDSDKPGTALIPAGVGAVILLCGLFTAWKPKIGKHLMHVSALIGLLGVLAAVGRLGMTLFKEDASRFGQVMLAIMALLCAGYVFACFQSFRAAGKARRAAAAQESGSADND